MTVATSGLSKVSGLLHVRFVPVVLGMSRHTQHTTHNMRTQHAHTLTNQQGTEQGRMSNNWKNQPKTEWQCGRKMQFVAEDNTEGEKKMDECGMKYLLYLFVFVRPKSKANKLLP